MNAPNSSEQVEHERLPASATAVTRTHRWGFGAFFLAEAIFLAASVVLAASFEDIGSAGSTAGIALALALILPTLLAGITAVVITLVRGQGPVADFGLRWQRSDIRTGLLVGGAGLFVTVFATALWTRWVGEDANSAVGSLLAGVKIPPALAVLLFFHVWLLAPVCEELMYRGLLWGAMERLRWSRFTVFVLSTAAFAIGHFEPERTVLLLVIAIPIGVARLITGRLTAAVIAHQVNNFLPALGLLLLSLGLLPGG